jgi:hypothetical protein
MFYGYRAELIAECCSVAVSRSPNGVGGYL